MQHPAEHATAHVVASVCFFLLSLVLVAIYLVNAERIGKYGIVLIRAKTLPRYVGMLFVVGAIVLGTGAMLPYRVVSIGYGGIGLAIALSGYLIFSSRVETEIDLTSGYALTTRTQPRV